MYVDALSSVPKEAQNKPAREKTPNELPHQNGGRNLTNGDVNSSQKPKPAANGGGPSTSSQVKLTSS